jgi:hypothetical protein
MKLILLGAEISIKGLHFEYQDLFKLEDLKQLANFIYGRHPSLPTSSVM